MQLADSSVIPWHYILYHLRTLVFITEAIQVQSVRVKEANVSIVGQEVSRHHRSLLLKYA